MPVVCPAPPEEAGIVIVVEKAALTLGVFRDRVPLIGPESAPACFPIALGGEPAGDKSARGDERTPTGTFRVTHKNPKSAFHLSLGLDYPQARHAEAAYAEGRIDVATRDRVVKAARAGGMPVRDTALGGDIYIHGGGTSLSTWTDGCVALDNAVMDWLFVAVSPGTRVVIRE
jgi:murein L,D-transpeptidase YafK